MNIDISSMFKIRYTHIFIQFGISYTRGAVCTDSKTLCGKIIHERTFTVILLCDHALNANLHYVTLQGAFILIVGYLLKWCNHITDPFWVLARI